MNSEDAAKLLDELNLDPDMIVTTQIRVLDMLLLNELVDSALSWNAESIYAGATDDPLNTRLVAAIEAYIAADKRVADS